MNKQVERLVIENPNISSGKLAMLTGLKSHTIRNYRRRLGVKSFWHYSGVGIPFMYFNAALVAYEIKKSNRDVFAGSFHNALLNVDRLIYCLDNNNGKLPAARRESYLKNLEFKK